MSESTAPIGIPASGASLAGTQVPNNTPVPGMLTPQNRCGTLSCVRQALPPLVVFLLHATDAHTQLSRARLHAPRHVHHGLHQPTRRVR
jgi:hypothetical protein